MIDKHFEKLRHNIFRELFKANHSFKIFWQIYYTPEPIKSIQDSYLTFFAFTYVAHHDIFCVAIYNIVKRSRSTGNIKRMLNYVESNKNWVSLVSRAEIEDLRCKLKYHEEIIEKIAKDRNQYIAHNQLDKKDLRVKLLYSFKEGKKLLGDLLYILNFISERYNDTIYTIDTIPKLNTRKMLKDLFEYKRQKIKESKRIKKAR